MSDNATWIKKIQGKPLPWLILGGLVTAVLFLLFLAPEEATLGTGIRSVYIHVSLIWTGMAGFVLAGLIGLVVLASANEKLARVMQTLGWVAFGFYLAGIGMSTIASAVNWGGVFWQEPRMLAAFNSLAIAAIFLVAILLAPWIRVRGAIQAAIPVIVAWITYNAPLVLHPENPIFSSEATGIQVVFISLFLLFAAIAAWIVWKLVK
ncbi:MAG: hypothetical protein WAM60_16960 [Candidatus Promineifilaceae bacterium]